MPFLIEKSHEIQNRKEFGLLCNKYGLIEAAEIGTDRGEFAWHFLNCWKGFTLICIDPYESYPEMPYDRLPDLLVATARLARFGERVRFIRAASPDVLQVYPAIARIDFAYIDGAHGRDSAAADIAEWWDRISPGGILAGHDYDKAHPGVMEAVENHARCHDLPVWLTFEGESPPSWYIKKPGQLPA